MAKVSISLLLLLAINTVCPAKEKRADIVQLEMDKLQEISLEIYKLLDEKASDDVQETLALRSFTSKFYLYAQDYLYYIYKAMMHTPGGEAFKDLKIIKDVVEEYTYKLGQRVNGDAAEIRAIVKNAFQHYQTLFPVFIRADKLLESKEDDELARYYARITANVALFNYHVAFGDLKYRKRPTQEIINKLRETYRKISESLEKFTSKTPNSNALVELQNHVEIFNYFTNRILYTMEIWIHNYQGDAGVSEKMVGDSASFLKMSHTLLRGNKTVAGLLAALKTLFEQSSSGLQKLVEIEENGDKCQKEICKEIFLESLGILTSFSSYLEILLQIK